MKTKKTFFLCVLIVGSINFMCAQNLLSVLEKEQTDTLGYSSPAFKMTRITFGHSSETRSKGVLEVFVANRFWNFPTERSQKFGADKMSTRFALEYGVADHLSFGVGATTFDKLFDGYLKYNLVSQKKGTTSFPVNITAFQSASYNSSSIPNPLIEDDFSDRLSFTSQLLISRKVTSNFSLQISPTFISKRIGFTGADPQNFIALGVGARYKIGSHVSVVSEYYNTFNTAKSFKTYGPFAIGANWEIGDVLLQFMLTNAVNMVEDTFITQTRNNFNFKNPNLNFGFNATYVIHFKNSLR